MKVAKWGNTACVRLPASLVQELRIEEGDEIDLTPSGRGKFESPLTRGGKQRWKEDAEVAVQTASWIQVRPRGGEWRVRRISLSIEGIRGEAADCMTGRVFLDTNLLIYAFARTAPRWTWPNDW